MRANVRGVRLATLCVVAAVLVARPASSQVPLPVSRPFSGSIQCRLETSGPTHSESRIHTWTFTGGAPTTANSADGQLWIHPAQWSVTGEGSSNSPYSGGTRYDTWTIVASPIDAAIAIRSRGADFVVELWHSPIQVTEGVSGSAYVFGGGFDASVKQFWKNVVREAPLTTIQGARTNPSLTGSSSAKLANNSWMLVGEEVVETCTWQLAPAVSQSNLPPPPPSGSAASNTSGPATIAAGRTGVAPARATGGPTNAVFGATPADGPWSGQAQCVLTATGPNYEDEQMHTWRLTGEPATLSGVFRQWPAVWSVKGRGSRQMPVASGRATAAGVAGPSESWTIEVPETKAPISIWQLAGQGSRLRIGSQHGLLVAYKAINIRTTSAGREIRSDGALDEWVFPVTEDDAAKTTIAGKFSRPVKLARGWRQPSSVSTTETCTWNFTRGDVDQSSRNGAQPSTTTAVLSAPGVPANTRATVSQPTAPAPPPPTPPSNRPPAGVAVSGTAPVAAPAGGTAIAGATRPTGPGIATLDPNAKACTTPGPAATASATPGGVTFKWPQVTGATGFGISRTDLGSLTASPITTLSYTHNAALDYHNPPYQYTITAFYPDGRCATSTVAVTAPKPITPKVTPTVTPGEQTARVKLAWGDQTDLPTSYLVLGPGLHENGAEVTASRSGQVLDIEKLPAGNHQWLVMPFWRTPTGIMSDVSNAARVTATVGVTSGRYQIFIAGFRVNNQTTDDPLNRDGWLDEIYAAAAVTKWEGGAVKSNEVAKSWVYGDANSSDRVRAGSGSGNGGLKAGDLVPSGWTPTSVQLPPETDVHRFPMKVWEGTLRNGDVVSVRPTLWEFDGDSGAYEYWKAWALSSPTWGSGLASPGLTATKGPNSPLYQFASGAQFADPGEAADALAGRDMVDPTAADWNRFDRGMKKTAARFFPGKDRIVGLDAYARDMRGFFIGPSRSGSSEEFDYSQIFWVDRQVAFTREKIEAALTASGSQFSVIPITLVDEDHNPLGPLHGDYTVYLRVQRMP